MSELRRTPLRHRILAEVAAGRMKVYVGLYNNLSRGDEPLRAHEKTAEYQLRHAWTYARYPGGGRSAPAVLTQLGRDLLADWNRQYGEIDVA